jgi:hypothetical protein
MERKTKIKGPVSDEKKGLGEDMNEIEGEVVNK